MFLLLGAAASLKEMPGPSRTYQRSMDSSHETESLAAYYQQLRTATPGQRIEIRHWRLRIWGSGVSRPMRDAAWEFRVSGGHFRGSL